MEAISVLADPTRRRIIELLAQRDSSVGELAAEFPVSQPAISRHLRVLREAGFVRSRGEAQRRIYRLEAKPLEEIDAWLQTYRRFWSGRLDRLERHLAGRKRSKGAGA